MADVSESIMKGGLGRLRHLLILALLLSLWLPPTCYGDATAAQSGSAANSTKDAGDDVTSTSAGWAADAASDLTNALRPIFASVSELPARFRQVADRIGESSGGLATWLLELLAVFAAALVALRLAPLPLARWRRTQLQSSSDPLPVPQPISMTREIAARSI